MGYDLHITRGDHWLDAEAHPITLEEWLAYVEQDPEMRLDGFAEAAVSRGQVLRTESPGLAVWVRWSQRGIDGGQAWFDHRKGCVVVKSPDDEIIQKMTSIAGTLQARIIGDDGETYPTTDHDSANPQQDPRVLLWWRRLFR